ncbi:hypothetical protein ACFOEE_05890 [Pseudoalteromonas fenneropenaei]|uniref:Alpha/beta hydrolase n=1 Tax=Pseudoalteromonas fenneropenaei TaxID=1737459 RepID=A0ABV7CHG0_9GAMM
MLAISPPHLDDKTAVVAPRNAAQYIQTPSVWLVTAANDEYVSKDDNLALYHQLATQDKQHIEIEGEHILPAGYYQRLLGWL